MKDLVELPDEIEIDDNDDEEINVEHGVDLGQYAKPKSIK